jgi:hypothetical protein
MPGTTDANGRTRIMKKKMAEKFDEDSDGIVLDQLCILKLFSSVLIRVHPWFQIVSSCAEAVEDCQSGFFGAFAALADRADA